MALRFPSATTPAARAFFRRAVLPVIVGWLMLAYAGCSYFRAKPIPPSPQQMQAYAEQQTALRNEVSQPKEELQEHCDQLALAPPGVEEIRTRQGAIESRQWNLVADGSAPRWAFARTKDASPDGWAPKPGLDKLNFQPPLEPALSSRSSVFLAYAPIDNATIDDSRKSATVREVFGAAQGNFTWRGRKYSYTLTPELPCFPQVQ